MGRRGGETQQGGRDKAAIKDHPPATLGRLDYLGKRLDQAGREMARMIDEDR